jgi:hypothetical protein
MDQVPTANTMTRAPQTTRRNTPTQRALRASGESTPAAHATPERAHKARVARPESTKPL